MSKESQKKNPDLHAKIIGLMQKIAAESLWSDKMTVHQIYDMTRRFVSGNKEDMKKAEERLRDTLNWRKKEQVDTLLDEDRKVCKSDVEELVSYVYPHAFHGTGAGGRVVYVERTGAVRRDIMYDKLSKDDCVLHFARILERGMATHWTSAMRLYNRQQEIKRRQAKPEESKSSDEPVISSSGLQLLDEYAEIVHHPFIFVFDLKGLEFGDISGEAIDYFKATVTTQQKHYPDCMFKMFIVNAPWYFTGGWDLLKVVIEKEVYAKIEVVGNEFKDILMKTIPESSIPTFLGGTCRLCEDQGGCVPIVKNPPNLNSNSDSKESKK